jgi:hypothetical protein
MPKTKHHKKKYPNSEWVRRRNIRKLQARLASKLDSLGKKVDTVDLSENIKKTHSPSQEKKPKGWWAGIKNAFAGRRRNTKDAV